jgi:alkylation response protein AidB-like acyl-CoA dehydrogenase
MDQYTLTDTQVELREAARKFARDFMAPAAMKADETREHVPESLIGEMREHGFLGLDIPEEHGGLGLDALTTAIIMEQLSGGWYTAATYCMNLSAGPLLAVGSDEQKRKYLPAIASGEIVPCFAITEDIGGSDASQLQTFASRDGDEYVINGTKLFITNAHRAGVVTLFARTTKDAERGKGITIFLIEKGTPGMKLGQKYRTLGNTGNPIWGLVFEDCRVPASAVLGEVDEGFSYMRFGFAPTRAVYGARCAGVAQAALDYAARYAQDRVQFGKPIAEFQALRFKMADMATEIEALRQLSYRACVLCDRDAPDAPVAAAMAKMFGGNVAMRVTAEAIQIMGGHGYICDHPLERYYREAKLFQIGDGTTEMQQLLISRHVNRQAQSGLTTALVSN